MNFPLISAWPQQTLIVKQDELTQLNRDNARLLAEARQLQKEQHAQQQLLAQKAQSLEDAQSALIGAERANEALEQRCGTLQEEVFRLSETSAIQAQQVQSLQERLAEAITHLKLLGHTPLTNSGNEIGELAEFGKNRTLRFSGHP